MGVNFQECTKAVLNAKRTLLKKRFQNDTEGGENHLFVLLTGINKNAEMMLSGSRKIAKQSSTFNNTALAALTIQWRDKAFSRLMG